MRSEWHRSGFSLLELLTVVAIVGLVCAVSIPQFLTMRRRAAVHTASRELMTQLRDARSRAVMSNRNTAIRFEKVNGVWSFAMYDDGDFDGVRNDDIASGVDRLVRRAIRPLTGSGGVAVALPPFPVPDPDGGTLDASTSPVKFGKAQLCSFSPNGSGTAGSLYLTDGAEQVGVVRVYGPTGRVRFMRYDRDAVAWR